MHSLFSVSELRAKWSSPPPKPGNLPSIYSSQDIFEVIFPLWEDIDMYESFWVVLLNNSNRILGISKISSGGINSTVVDPKLILQRALISNSAAFVCVHNHPSGRLKPSDADEKLTRKIKLASAFLDMKFLDHLIITPDMTYFSFADEGII